MERKIMVEVTEEELKELNKEKTLDDYVDGLLKCLNGNKPTRALSNIDTFTYQKVATKVYETERFNIAIIVDDINNPQVRIEMKKGKGLWKI